MGIDSALRDIAAAKEAEFHRIMVKAGVRKEGSTVEDHRLRPVVYEAPVVEGKVVTVRDGEMAP